MKEENVKNEEIKEVEGVVSDVNENEEMQMVTNDFSQMQRHSNTKRKIYTTIEDQKIIFNLETACDYKINDCKNEKIRVVDLLIKVNEKELDEPVINEETGEIIKDKERSMVTILIDESGKSYVTASKMFTIQMMNYVNMFGLDNIKQNGLDIEIIERAVKNSSNKALGFKLV